MGERYGFLSRFTVPRHAAGYERVYHEGHCRGYHRGLADGWTLGMVFGVLAFFLTAMICG